MSIDNIKLRDAFDTLLKTEYTNQDDIKELNKFYKETSKVTEYTEEEKIIGFLSTINKDNALFAKDINKEIGVSQYKVAGFVKKIEKLNGSLQRIHNNAYNLKEYYGDLDDEY